MVPHLAFAFDALRLAAKSDTAARRPVTQPASVSATTSRARPDVAMRQAPPATLDARTART
jgi:hypothetical protein